jgi:hypothetical protein
VETIFKAMLELIDLALPDKEIFDCHADTDFAKIAYECMNGLKS